MKKVDHLENIIGYSSEYLILENFDRFQFGVEWIGLIREWPVLGFKCSRRTHTLLWGLGVYLFISLILSNSFMASRFKLISFKAIMINCFGHNVAAIIWGNFSTTELIKQIGYVIPFRNRINFNSSIVNIDG